jgi:hypothetical protein
MERSKQKTIGIIPAVPCPWCNRTNDLTDLKEQMLLEKGAKIDCDHCKRISVVDAIDGRPRIILKQFHGR